MIPWKWINVRVPVCWQLFSKLQICQRRELFGLLFASFNRLRFFSCAEGTWVLQLYRPCLRRWDIRSTARGSEGLVPGHFTSTAPSIFNAMHVYFYLTLNSIFYLWKSIVKKPCSVPWLLASKPNILSLICSATASIENYLRKIYLKWYTSERCDKERCN